MRKKLTPTIKQPKLPKTPPVSKLPANTMKMGNKTQTMMEQIMNEVMQEDMRAVQKTKTSKSKKPKSKRNPKKDVKESVKRKEERLPPLFTEV